MVLQHGGSILGSVILCGTFRRISQLWDDAHTLNLENCLLYLLSTISQFLDFVRCIVFDFIFYCVTVHTLYIIRHRKVMNLCFPSVKGYLLRQAVMVNVLYYPTLLVAVRVIFLKLFCSDISQSGLSNR